MLNWSRHVQHHHEHRHAKRARTGRRKGLGRPHVLVVDDDPDTLTTIAGLLRSDGYAVTTASDGLVALEHARRSLPDVVVTDLTMKPIDGVELCKRLRELDGDLPVVVMTAHSDMKSVIDSMHAGAEDYLVKPLEYEVVVLCIDRVVARRRERVELQELQRAFNERLVLSNLREQDHAEVEARHAAQLEALLETLNEGVIIVEATGRIVLMNGAGRAINGLEKSFTLESLNALDAFDVEGQPLARQRRPLMRALAGERFTDYEVVRRDANGARRRIVSTATNVRDERGKVALAIVVFRDVTQLRLLEKEREEYLALVSHDLRNPLTSIVGFVSLLKSSLGEHQGPLLEIAERAERNAKRMASMLEELTEATTLEAHGVTLRREPCDLHALIRNLVDGMDGALARRITLETHGAELVVQGDSARLERVIMNLLTNALKYSASDAPVKVRLARRDGVVEIEVEDAGIGVAPEHQHRLFERFYRTTAGQKSAGGLGLGLYIARLIVEAHGGRIGVTSQPGRGSTFQVTLPISSEARASST
jgi:PAS domain S-box-containing protein